MKGFFDEPWWTIAVALVAIGSFIIIIFFMIYSTLRTSDVAFIGGHNNAFRQSMKFVDVVEDPFIISSVISDLRQENRDVYEHATQIMTTAKIDESDENFGIDNHGAEEQEEEFSRLGEFLDVYDIKYYSVLIEKNNIEIKGLNNLPNRCGEHFQGFCQRGIGPLNRYDIGVCDVGRIQIDDDGKCSTNWVCCQAVDEEVYKNYAEDEDNKVYDVVPCGRPQIGICSVGINDRPVPCGEGGGRNEVTDFGDCGDVNDGDTPNCCVTLAPETLQSLKYTVVAEVPLIYKDNFGTLEVGVGE